MNDITRRGFCGGLATAVVAQPAVAALKPAPNLRVGVVSDIHLVSDDPQTWFEKALRYFDKVKVDAVAVAGDLTCYSRIREMNRVADAWRKVFPEDRRSDGAHVERLIVTGNHDTDAWNCTGKRPFGFKDMADAKANCFYFNRDKVWRDLFGEPYEQVMVKECRGYLFVMRNWISFYGNPKKGKSFPDLPLEENPIREKIAELDGRLRGDRPFFYIQHDQLNDTVNAPWLRTGVRFQNGYDDGLAKSVLDAYPNCLALTGHSHSSLTDEQSIWQGSFTAVNCSCLCGFAFTSPGRENGFAGPDFGRKPPFEMDKFDHRAVHQGMVMDVYDDRIVFAKRDFGNDQSLGEDWVVPLFGGRTVPPEGTPKYDPRARAMADAKRPPRFSGSAKITTAFITNGLRRTASGIGGLDKTASHAQVEVSFPPVTTAHSPVRGFDYGVKVVYMIGDCTRVIDEKRVFSPNGFLAERCETVPVTCRFDAAILPNKGVVRFVVTPFDCWGNAGESICSAWAPAGSIMKEKKS